MTAILIPITVQIDWPAGVIVRRSSGGRELDRAPIPDSVRAAYREMREAALRVSVLRRCAGHARRQRRARGGC